MNNSELNRLFRRELNVRELGGYRTKDGRRVRMGHFYRSSAPGLFNDAELLAAAGLGLKYIFDFRSEVEASRLPDPEIKGCANIQMSAIKEMPGSRSGADVSPEGIDRLFRKMIQERPLEAVHIMDSVYAGLMHDNAVFHRMFEVIRENRTPILFHCSAGKDRTGTAAILILMMLGVSEEDAMRDYLLTNEYRRSLVERDLERFADLLKIRPECSDFVGCQNGVSPVNAKVVFDEIRNCGGIEKYMFDEFGIDDSELASLRDQYLERV